MARRGKIVLARISNEGKRRASLRKRKSGLLKKVNELTVLCDAEAAVVVYSPGDNQPTIWPSTSESRATISKFLSRPELERMANSHTAKSFTEEKCMKKKNKAQRLIKMNEEMNIQALITSICNGKTRTQDLDSEQKKKLCVFADKKEEEILKHIQRLKGKEQQAPHSPQVLPSALQMPPVSQAASGRQKMNGLAAGRNFPSPAAAHGKLINVRGMTRLAPPLPLSLPTHNPLVMSPDNSEANRIDMTRRLYGQTHPGGMMQQAHHPPQALSLALQMPPVSQAASGLNMNGHTGGQNFPSPAAAAHGQHMNLRGMTRGAPFPHPLSLPTPNPLVMLPNNSAANSLDMIQRIYGQTDLGGMMQQSLPSPLSMAPPDLSTVPTIFSAGSVPDMTDYSLISTSTRAHIGEGNFRRMKQHAPPPSLPLDFSPIHSSSNRLYMTGRLYEQTNFGDMMQYSLSSPLSLPPPRQIAIQHVQSTAIRLDMTDNGLINASTRTFTEDGNFGGMIQHGPPPHMPLELPRRLGLPPMPPTQHEASVSNLIGDEYSCNSIRYPAPETTALDQSNFGNDYRWKTNGFPALDQSNFDDGMSNGGWVDGDAAFEVSNAPPFNIK